MAFSSLFRSQQAPQRETILASPSLRGRGMTGLGGLRPSDMPGRRLVGLPLGQRGPGRRGGSVMPGRKPRRRFRFRLRKRGGTGGSRFASSY